MMDHARAPRSRARRWSALAVVLALHGCSNDSFSVPGGNTFPAPVPRGGMPPLEGSELLDRSFATKGVFESFDFVERAPIRVEVDRFSRPLIAGIGARPSGLLVLRLTDAGTSDATFGAGGAFRLPDDASGAVAFALRAADCRLDAFERILLFSTHVSSSDLRRAVVVRLDPDGVLDASFGDRGRVVLEPAAGATETSAVSLLADPLGGFVACADESGPAGTRMIVRRFDEHGALDADFGELGTARGPEQEPSSGARVVLDAGGRIVVAGTLPSAPARVALWRFDADGSADLAFGVDGLVARSDRDAGVGAAAVDATTDASERILVLGQRARELSEFDHWPGQLVDFKTSAAPIFDAIVWRFLPDGSPDLAFGDAGARVLAFNSGAYVSVSGGLAGGDHFDGAAALFLEDDERIVVAGWSDPATWGTSIGWATFGPTRPFLVRLDTSGALDPTFHGVGHAQLGWDFAGGTTVFARGHLTSATRDASGRWLLAGGSEIGSSQRVWRLAP